MWLVIILVLILAFGGMPVFGLHHYGWGPSGLLGMIVLVLVLLMLLGRF